MSRDNLRKKYGIVVLLDALGASEYSEDQIKQFLSARQEINHLIRVLSGKNVTSKIGNIGKFHTPEIFTFGDTVIITIQLNSKKHRNTHLFLFSFLMRRYIFHSFENGILFRGSFSIGSYIADSESNTVMGEAVSDAAAWYEQSEWMGLSSTPKTNTVLEYLVADIGAERGLDLLRKDHHGYIHPYDVPMKNGKSYNLYTINWPSAFFDEALLKGAKKKNGEQYFLELLQGFPVPKGTEDKYINIKRYFDSFKKSANKSLKDAP
jgi:hypothetical protein